jgi:hypothetical protein
MKCPHYGVSFHDNEHKILIGSDVDGAWFASRRQCAACKRFVLFLLSGSPILAGNNMIVDANPVRVHTLVYPKATMRPPCPIEVPAEFADDYKEACLVFSDSPKASAALTRRCLQNLLRDYFRVKHGNLAEEIQQILDSGKLSSGLAEEIDAVRNVGNFAAHPMKSQQSGQIIPVEPGEAEWNLEVIESLFDFCFVQPAARAKRKAAFNQKLQEAGKNPIK